MLGALYLNLASDEGKSGPYQNNEVALVRLKWPPEVHS